MRQYSDVNINFFSYRYISIFLKLISILSILYRYIYYVRKDRNKLQKMLLKPRIHSQQNATNKANRQNMHKNDWLVVSTNKCTVQNACECHECFPFGVGKLEMCKGNAYPVCAQRVPLIDLFEAFRMFGVYGSSPWINWNVCFHITIMAFSPAKCLEFLSFHSYLRIEFLETVQSFLVVPCCLKFWPLRDLWVVIAPD